MARKPAAKSGESGVSADTRILALHGPEAAIQKEHVDRLKASLEAAHGELQVFHFEGKAATLAEVFDEVRGYSLMGGYKLVVVDQADDFVKAHREPLERYAQKPVDHATLVLRAHGWHPGNLDKHIKKVGAVVKCEPPKPPEAVARLVARAAEHHGLTLERPAAQLLVDRLGVHLVRLETELDKLAAMAMEGKKITRDMVEQAVGRSSDEKAWEVQEAILQALGAGSTSRFGRPPGRASLSGGVAPGRQGPPSSGASGGSGGGGMIAKVRELIDVGGQPETLVTYFVADLARKLAVGGQMLAAGESEASIARAMKLWGPKTGLFMGVLRKVGAGGGAKMLDKALTSDARSKSGFGDAGRNLESLCVTLADVAR